MLFKILDNIREKPKSVRDQYALLMAVGCTVLVAGAWSLSLPSRFAQQNVAESGEVAPGIFSGLFSQFKNQFKAADTELLVATSSSATGPESAASSTAAALDFQISAENRAELASSTGGDGRYQFATATPKQTILIATTSATTTTR